MEINTVGSTDEQNQKAAQRRFHIPLVVYDLLILLGVSIAILWLNPSYMFDFAPVWVLLHFLISAVCIFTFRYIFGVYRQIWRYSTSISYLYLIISDILAGICYFLLTQVLPIEKVSFVRACTLVAVNLLISISIRLLYQFLYEHINNSHTKNGFLCALMSIVTGLPFDKHMSMEKSEIKRLNTKIKIAIVGAGQVGAMLAEELIKNPFSTYHPCCFIDIDQSKIGRVLFGLPVLSGDEEIFNKLKELSVQEIVFALPQLPPERIKSLYEFYKNTGCKIKVYDYPMMQAAEGGKRHMREFDLEDLLFRKSVKIENPKTNEYYKDKVVLITGGGGSIGSELCRQIARMQPKTLIILDVYENGAYDIQQELRIAYGSALDLCVEIVSVCDKNGLEKVFSAYKPNVVLHAAAHKHVPLMEHNVCEAIKNNVFGTLNTVELSEKYGVDKFIMVSTDKAVNPTNVMGATKRACEMIVLSHSLTSTKTSFSATRFGNVLGSVASVVPLFKKQIMKGGPVTVTDKRIIRYFMTIPEASQLVLQSGAMAKNGELFVLDMGKAIRILELAETMIRLCGFEPYRDIDIIETGLRPGEKLYEELLIRPEELDKTQNDLIFIERDIPLSQDAIAEKLNILKGALMNDDDATAKAALMSIVPTYRKPDDVNSSAITEQKLEKLEKSSV